MDSVWTRTVFMVAVGAVAGCFGKGIGDFGGKSCTSAADCSRGQVCAGGHCSDPGTGLPGSPCSATRDCSTGNYCDGVAGMCSAGGTIPTGGSCTSDKQCLPPLRCSLSGFYGTCAEGGTVDIGGGCATSQECLSGLWCGTNGKCAGLADAYPPYAGATCADEGAFRAYFEVPRPGRPPADFFRLPFPNDIRVSPAGALDISDFPKPGPTPLGVDLVQLYVDAWTADFDGFSAAGAVTFRFSAPLDYSTATQAAVKLIDLTAGPSFGAEFGRLWVTNNGRTKYSCNHTIAVRNFTDSPYEPRHTYAVLLTTGIRDETGVAAAPDADFTAMLAATPPTDASLLHAWNAYKPLRDWITKEGAAAPPLAAAALFTVQDAPGHVGRLATSVAAQPAPVLSSLTLCSTGATSPCADGTPERACGAPDPAFDEVHGKLTIPIYQQGTAPYETPEQGGGIMETAGMPVVARTEEVCFALTVPKGSSMPAAGWPLVVYHHGTGGSMRSFIAERIAGKLAAGSTPTAVLGFDAVEHGARKGGSTKKSDDLVFNPLNPRAARDNFLQGAVDVLQAIRVATLVIPETSSPTTATIAFDPARVAFFGHSQGSTSGELAMPWTNATSIAVFSGAGSHLTSSLLDKTMPVNIAAGMTYLLGEKLDAEHPVMTLFQSYFDRSDPLSANPLIVTRPPTGFPSKHVYMSWGRGDTYTPKSTLTANANSLGLPLAGTEVEDYGVEPIARPVSLNVMGGDGVKRSGAVVQYAPSGFDGHFVSTKDGPATADWMSFLQSWLATGTPTIP
jgi:hypothetical protein